MEIGLPILRARRARGHLLVDGEDILAGLNTESIIDFCYSDNTSDKADDLKVTIADPGRTWMQQKLPKKGIKCEASITIENWTSPGDNRPFRCGTFYINHVHFKGPPNTVEVKASSVPPNGVKSTKKNKAWESSTLKGIAEEIATANELELYYDTQDNPTIKRVDQKEKTDLEFIRERAKEQKLSMKVHDGKLIVYSEEEYEARPPIHTFDYGRTNYMEFDFNSKTDDTYESATNSHVNTETGKITETTFPDLDDESNFSRITIPKGTKAKLRTSEDVEEEPDDRSMRNFAYPILLDDESFHDDRPSANKGKGKGRKKNSKKKAKAKLREKNKKEHQCSIKDVGNPSFLSGLNVETTGFGIFDMKWFIESSTHEIASGGYTTHLRLRGCLSGY